MDAYYDKARYKSLIARENITRWYITRQIDQLDQNKEIWDDNLVLHFLKIQYYPSHASALEKDGVQRRAKSFRLLPQDFYNLQDGGMKMQCLNVGADRIDHPSLVHRVLSMYFPKTR